MDCGCRATDMRLKAATQQGLLPGVIKMLINILALVAKIFARQIH